MLNSNKELELNSKDAQGKRIRYIRDEILHLSRREFARHHGDLKITEAVLQNWEEGRFKGLKDQQANLLLKAFEREGILCEKHWLLTGLGNPPCRVTSSEFQGQEKIDEIDAIANELRNFHATYTDSIDSIVNDDALEPFFQIGDHVAGVRYIGDKVKETIGQFCIVQTSLGEILIRKVEKSDEPGLYNLSAFNPNTEVKSKKNIQLFSAAPILWWRRRLSSNLMIK